MYKTLGLRGRIPRMSDDRWECQQKATEGLVLLTLLKTNIGKWIY